MQFPNQFQDDSFDKEGLMLVLFTWWKMSKKRNKEGLKTKIQNIQNEIIFNIML